MACSEMPLMPFYSRSKENYGKKIKSGASRCLYVVVVVVVCGCIKERHVQGSDVSLSSRDHPPLFSFQL